MLLEHVPRDARRVLTWVRATGVCSPFCAASVQLFVDERPILDSEPDRTTARFAGVPAS